jgi:sterol desaturase/sphingolipid hydroxylase (fatty acid hydroxylase superfamily)
MFRVEWIERYLSRVRPWQVMAVWTPVSLWFLAEGLWRGELGPGRVAALFLLGVLAWTLLEYLLHRWVFHFEPRPGHELEEDLSFLVHGVHHDYPYDPDRLVMPPAVSLFLAFAVGLPLRAGLGPARFPAIFAGLVAGYVWYDLTHYAVHHLTQRTAFGRMLRRNHYLHHFRHPGQLFGVTSPLWDLVFRTYLRAEPEPISPRPLPRRAPPATGRVA